MYRTLKVRENAWEGLEEKQRQTSQRSQTTLERLTGVSLPYYKRKLVGGNTAAHVAGTRVLNGHNVTGAGD